MMRKKNGNCVELFNHPFCLIACIDEIVLFHFVNSIQLNLIFKNNFDASNVIDFDS